MFFINIVGLSIGVAAALFIYMFVLKEFKTDRFHERSSGIYRVIKNVDGSVTKNSFNDYQLGNLLKKNFSEIEDFTRYEESTLFKINVDEKQFKLQKITFVDRSFFNIFDFGVSVGDINEVFNSPNKVFITKEVAYKYFNSIDVLGKDFVVVVGNLQRTYTVAGILADYPEESTLQPHIIADIKEHESFWNLYESQLFLYIPNSSDQEKIVTKFSETIVNEKKGSINRPDRLIVDPNKYELQKLTDLYLGSANVNDELPKGNKQLAKILMLIGVVLLTITFINNIIANLGVVLKDRKNNKIHNVLGCSNSWLKRKIISESVLFSVLAFLLSLFFYPIIHKVISGVSDYQYSLLSKSDFTILFSFLIILILFGILSGLILNLFVQNSIKQRYRGIQFGTRKAVFSNLIQLQLIIFIATTISLFFIVRQLNYMQTMELGFDANNTYSLLFADSNDMKLFKQEIEKYPYVKSVSWGEQLYRRDFQGNDVKIAETEKNVNAQIVSGDADYLKTYKMGLLQGNNFENGKVFEKGGFFEIESTTVSDFYEKELWKEPNTNTLKEVLVNEEFVKQSGLKDPIGAIIEYYGSPYQIVGVFNDVRNLPVYQSIKPTIIGYEINGSNNHLVISIEKGAEGQFESMARAFYSERNFEDYFDMFFLHFDFEKEYKNEQVFSKLITICTIIILCILILGLIGLSLFLAESKTKEIGVRKVNGAKIIEILTLLNRDFIKWVAISFIIAMPVSYYIMNKWLQNFAYKTELSWWIFAIAGVLTLGIALLTVSYQSWKAATRNPVEALRYE